MEEALVRSDVAELVDLMKQAIAKSMVDEDPSQVDKKCLEVLKVVLQGATSAVNTQITNINKLDAVNLASNFGNILLEIDNIQCFEPRGRFNLKVTSTSILLEGKQFSVLIPIQAVQEVVCLPSFTSAKKEGEDYLALKLDEPVKVNTKESTTILLNLSRSMNPSTRSVNGDNDLNEATVVMMSIQDATGEHISRPQASLFATVRDQKPFLKCYRGTQEGAIYPLQSGVVFIKPLLFISADEIASITAGRGGGAGNTRYVDLMIETADEKSYEFTNIDREELPALQMYVKGYLEARAARAQQHAQKEAKAKKLPNIEVVDLEGDQQEDEEDEERAGAGGGEGDLEDSDDSDEDDDDYDPDASDSDTPHRSKRRRAASDSDNSDNSDDNSDDDDSDNSDESDDSDASDAGSSSRPVKKSAKLSKAGQGEEAAKKKTTKRTTSSSKQTTKSPVKSPAKRAAVAPGAAIKRETPLPGQPIRNQGEAELMDLTDSGPVVLTTTTTAQTARAKEGRKSSAPQKKAPKESRPVSSARGGSTAAAAVKKEPPVPGSVIHLDQPKVVDNNSRTDVAEIVNLTAPSVKMETIDPSVAAAAAFMRAKASAAPVAGAKRTIMDMFGPAKKSFTSATSSSSSDIVKIE